MWKSHTILVRQVLFGSREKRHVATKDGMPKVMDPCNYLLLGMNELAVHHILGL
jgi:hypothetical protein